MIGKKLGHYEIQSLLGAGGMGEVYRARDTRLDRTVAVKVLPPHLSNQLDVRERFEREARTISSLNHPHICTLYDVGRQDETEFLVMEYLEGETLADRLKKGPLPIDQAMTYAIQIADALDKAHRLGVVHRDLKPGNIMITASGAKLLDFGLAKLTIPPGRGAVQTASQMPTNAPLTMQGTILGTLQYMAPEQLEGQDTDARADIFSFGAVLYQMVTGQLAFQGKSQVTLISAIVSSEPPPVSRVLPEAPAFLDHVIQRCLAKDPDGRWQTASDVLQELRWIAAGKPAAVAAARPAGRGLSKRIWMMVSAVLALGLIAAGLLYMRTPVPESIPMRLSVIPPVDSVYATNSGGAPWPELSPDGRRMVFGAVLKNGKLLLFLRSLDSETPQPLSGTEDGQQPFWSPDGRFIAFFAQNKLKKIDTAGGAPQTICSIEGTTREGTWGSDDSIVFAIANTPLWRVSASGGDPHPLTELDKTHNDAGHLYPHFLPDGRHFVFLAQGSEPAQSSISVGSLDSREIKRLIGFNSKAEYAAPGYLLYVRQSALVAQPYDAKRLELNGEAFPIVENIRHTNSSGIAAFSVAGNGAIAFRTGEATENTQFVWFDRSGKELGKIAGPGEYFNPELSPDGKEVALERNTESNHDIWILELARSIFTRFTSGPGYAMKPVWSHDGSQILYGQEGSETFVLKSVNGVAKEESLIKRTATMFPADWSVDGKSILYDGGQVSNLWVLPLDDHKPRALSETRFSELEARFSPNGRWISYASNESGRYEVYARSFPSNENKIQISTNGGTKARWRRDGKEIFYIAPDDKLMAVSVNGDSKLEVKPPEALFETDTVIGSNIIRSLRQQYDVTADGKRFLFLTPAQTVTPPPVTVFTNWQALLPRAGKTP